MTIIARAVACFKEDPQLHLDYRLVHEACVAAGYDWRGKKGGHSTLIGEWGGK
jgi:hypothetical protein